MFPSLRPDFYPKDDGYDTWDVIADYIFQVIFLSLTLLGDLTLSMEAL